METVLLFLLFIFFDFVSNTVLTNINAVEDPYTLMSSLSNSSSPVDHSEQNLFANIISNDPSCYEEFVPNYQTNHQHYHHEHFSDYNQISSLSSSDLQEIESMGNERNDLQHMEYNGNTCILRGETSVTVLADEVVIDNQMHVNESNKVEGRISKRSRKITLMDLQQQYGKKVKDAAESLGVSRSTFKRICRDNGIARWSKKLRITQQPVTATLTQSNIGVKVSYNGLNVKFPMSLSSRKKDLEFEIEKRFGIESGSYCIKYEDDEDKDWILINCDEDLHHGMHTCFGRGTTKMKMQAADLFLNN